MDSCTDALSVWKAAAREGKAPADAVLHKQYIADSIKAEGDRSYTFTISTGAIDRDRDTLAVEGWKTVNFLKAGGPVLWAHQSRDLPIGKSPWVKPQGGVLKARVEFAPQETYAFAETVRRLVDFGALKSTSVGFIPDIEKARWNDERGGFDFKSQELLEFSIVPIPANPEALLDAKAAGIDTLPLRGWAEKMLDTFEPGQWLSKAAMEQTVKALSEPRIVVPAFDAAPIVAEFTKRGRTLSAVNESRIRTAADAASAIGAVLDEVLVQVAEEEAPASKAAPVLYVSPTQTFLVDPVVVQAAVAAAVSRTVREQVNTARGRLD